MSTSPPARTIAPITVKTARKPSDTAMLTVTARPTRLVGVEGSGALASMPRKYDR